MYTGYRVGNLLLYQLGLENFGSKTESLVRDAPETRNPELQRVSDDSLVIVSTHDFMMLVKPRTVVVSFLPKCTLTQTLFQWETPCNPKLAHRGRLPEGISSA